MNEPERPFDDGGLERYEGTPETPLLADILATITAERDPPFRFVGHREIPFARLARPLAETRVALVTTAGLHPRAAAPFAVMERRYGDASFRVVPQALPADELALDAPYVDRKHVTQDPEVALPRAALARLHERGLVGPPTARHASFCGGILRPFPELREHVAALCDLFVSDEVGAVLLCPTCPTCVQTAGLVAGLLEERGLPTVSLSLLPELSRITRAPRTLAPHFPFGAPCGDPGNGALHEAIVMEALALLERADEPGLVQPSKHAWRR